MLFHANGPDDIHSHHLRGSRTVLLVDSVVNSGKTIEAFVWHIGHLGVAVRIIILAGVDQDQAFSNGGRLRAMDIYGDLNVVALRLSKNKFTGKGRTDTDNHLFNIIHLD
jgi:hypothetical protein